MHLHLGQQMFHRVIAAGLAVGTVGQLGIDREVLVVDQPRVLGTVDNFVGGPGRIGRRDTSRIECRPGSRRQATAGHSAQACSSIDSAHGFNDSNSTLRNSTG